jgi:hypothetical protein
LVLLRHNSRFHLQCTRLKKSSSALDIFDESSCFLQAESCCEAIEFDGPKLVTSVEGINNLGGETLVRAKFDASISHQEIELCFYPAQPPAPLSKIVDSARVQYTQTYRDHSGHYDKKDVSIDDGVHEVSPLTTD